MWTKSALEIRDGNPVRVSGFSLSWHGNGEEENSLIITAKVFIRVDMSPSRNSHELGLTVYWLMFPLKVGRKWGSYKLIFVPHKCLNIIIFQFLLNLWSEEVLKHIFWTIILFICLLYTCEDQRTTWSSPFFPSTFWIHRLIEASY